MFMYILVINLLFMSIITALSYINKKISPILIEIAEMEIRNISNIVINRALLEQLELGIDVENLFIVIKNDDGEIQTVDFNPVVVNKVLNIMTSKVYSNLKAISSGNLESIKFKDVLNLDENNLKKGIVYEVPIGRIFDNAFLANLGPKIPVRLNLVGDVISNIKTNITPYGINNALIEVLVYIELREQIHIPFTSKLVTISSNIPIAIKMIQGNVPNYYGGGLSKESNIFSIPIE